MFQSNIHWQSWVLAALAAIGAPPFLIHLRIFFADTAISLNLALLLMQIPVILAAVIWGFISIPAMATFLDSIPNHSKHLI